MATFGGEDHHDGADDDTLPEPIYLSRRVLEEYYNSRIQHVDEDDLFESEDEAEETLDLTAPPLESWFHGRISRHAACERLEMVGDPGAYLVRESIQLPGDYAISFLSYTGHVHHFKINSNCGNYYIGGRQFYSLGDLIGFYANCSHILENESLAVPVVPPKPVPLYMMLQATSSYTKKPNSDELTIAQGEVFLLMTKLNDDWGWGRSQRTGESGLIPIVIMEDVTDQDSNLGKPWFHGAISRDEANDLLLRKGEVGSFLLRKAGSPGGEDVVRYSLSVRTLNGVQRFLVQKFVTGYYIFGGRPFNSVEDIIERYRNEFILDNLRLVKPFTLEQTALHVRGAQAPVSSSSVAKGDINIPHVKTGDKSGRLMLKKGKKSPVYGKWKDFHFVLNFAEQKLLYYDQDTSHRARGLLDMRQCRVYAVHPSLFGRHHCLVVMLRYLNETTFYYLAAESAELAQEWMKLLRQCTLPESKQEKAEIQQIKSLSLIIKDLKLNRNQAQVFTNVFVDGVCLARTRSAACNDGPCVFDENFDFDDLSPHADHFSCEVQVPTKRGIVGSFVGRDPIIGRVHIHLSDLPNGQEDDKWHQLVQSGGGAKSTSRGSLRLVANFKDHMILPLEEYAKLKELILSDDLLTIEVLAMVCKDHHAELASTLIHIFCQYDRVVPILTACLKKSIDKEVNTSTLFRASTLSTMLMDQFMKLTASQYLQTILKEPIAKIMESTEPCELNPSFLARSSDLQQNLDRLEEHVNLVLELIFSSVDMCPETLRYIFRSLQDQVIQKWPTDDSVRTRAVSGFLFLRFVCPALLKPQLFDLVSEPPSPTADRTLKLVTKTTQNIANLVEFKVKENFMTALNPFVQRCRPHMIEFIDSISRTKDYSSSVNPPHIELDTDPRKDLAAIHHLCVTYEKSLTNLVQKEPEVKRLLGVLQSLRASEKRFTNKFSS